MEISRRIQEIQTERNLVDWNLQKHLDESKEVLQKLEVEKTLNMTEPVVVIQVQPQIHLQTFTK